MSINKQISIFTALIVFTCMAAAQDQTQGQPAKAIKHVPIKATSPVSGKDMYTAYCAVCHGADGKGGGPAASALKVPPTDLTLLSKNNGGKYPALKVTSALHGESALPAHGSKEMPVWGAVVLEYEQWTRGRGAATRHEPYQVHRISAAEVGRPAKYLWTGLSALRNRFSPLLGKYGVLHSEASGKELVFSFATADRK